MRKLVAGFLCLAMFTGIFLEMPFAVSAAQSNTQQIVNTGGSNPQNDDLNQDGVSVSKVISPTDRENYFDITLTVKTQEQLEKLIKTQTTEVVIVMDCSNTMNEKFTTASGKVSRLEAAKTAAKIFVDDYCSDSTGLGGTRKLNFVTFNTDAKVIFSNQKADSANAASMKQKIQNITAVTGASRQRFTNVEAGLQLAQNLLSSSGAQHKYIILLTDGFPTTYINNGKNDRSSKSSITGYDPYMSDYTGQKVYGTDGYFYDPVHKDKNGKKGLACLYGVSYSDKAADKAKTAAQVIKNKKINIFSVGIDIGGQSIQNYINKVNTSCAGYSIIDCYKSADKNGYVIGGASDKNAYISWLRNQIAGGPDLSGSAVRYCDGSNQEALKTAYNNILNEIKTVNWKAIEEAWVSKDPMGDAVEFKYIYSQSGTPAGNSVRGANALAGENTAAYADGTLQWNLMQSGYTKSVSGNKTTYQYTVKYQVRLKNEEADFKQLQSYVTNKTTTLYYKTNTNGTLSAENTLDFPIPEVKGYLGELCFYKVDDDQQPVKDAQFTLTHDSAVCSVCKGDARIRDMVKSSAENGLVKFTGIPSGHTYTLEETRVPAGYHEPEIQIHTVKVSYGNVFFDGELVSAAAKGAEDDEPDEKNVKKIYLINKAYDPAKISFHAKKTLNGKEPGKEIFQFELQDSAGNILQTVSCTKQGTVKFQEIELKKIGTYVYYLAEKAGADSNIAYDKTTYKITVTVTADDTAGKLTSKAVYEKQNEDGSTSSVSADALLFSNQNKTKNLTIRKSVTGAMANRDQEFLFMLKVTDSQGKIYSKDLPILSESILAAQTYGQESIKMYTQVSVPVSDSQAASGYSEKYLKATEGIYCFKLKSAESITVQIPYGYEYTVTEEDYSKQGYYTSVEKKDTSQDQGSYQPSINPDSGKLEENTEILFTNIKDIPVPTGIFTDEIPFLIMAGISIWATLFFFMISAQAKKQRKN